MDPNATLAELLELTREAAELLELWEPDEAPARSIVAPEDVERLAALALDVREHVDALDGWLSRGGFLPERWSREAAAPELVHVDVRFSADVRLDGSGMESGGYVVEHSIGGAGWHLVAESRSRADGEAFARAYAAGVRCAGGRARITSGGAVLESAR